MKATDRLEGRKVCGFTSSRAGRTVAPMAVSKGVCGSGTKKPATTTGSDTCDEAVSGATSCSSQSDSSQTPASSEAITLPVAAWMAILRPREMLAPGLTSTQRGKRSAYSWIIATVLSCDPPSTITISSGRRVWTSRLSIRRRIDSPSFRTVLMTVTCMESTLDQEQWTKEQSRCGRSQPSVLAVAGIIPCQGQKEKPATGSAARLGVSCLTQVGSR